MKRGCGVKKIRKLVGLGIIALILGVSGAENKTEAAIVIEEKIVGGLGFTALLKPDGTVWTWGINDTGQLGQNDSIDRSQPTLIPQTFFASQKIINIEASYYGVLAKTETGDLYVWGSETFKPAKLGNFPTVNYFYESSFVSPNYHKSQHILMDGKIKQRGSGYQYQTMQNLGGYSAGNSCVLEYNFSTFVKEAMYSAQVEVCPTNSAFQKHIDGTQTVVDNAIKMHKNQYAGSVLFLNSLNELYIGGSHFSGRNNTLPKKLNTEPNIIKEVYDAEYPMFLNENNELFIVLNVNNPAEKVLIEGATTPIKEVKVGYRNTWILTEDNKVFAIGVNDQGQLGNVIPQAGVSYTLKKAVFTGIQNVEKIGYGIGHFPFKSLDGNIYIIGTNATGQLGKEDGNSKKVFTKINWGFPITSAAYNRTTLLFGDDQKKLYVAGGETTNQRILIGGDKNIPQLVNTFTANVINIDGDADNNFVTGSFVLENGQMYGYGQASYLAKGGSSGYGLLEVINRNVGLTGDFTIENGDIVPFGGIALSRSNIVYSWGRDEGGALGLGYNYIVPNPSTGGTTVGEKPSFEKVLFDDTIDVKQVKTGTEYQKMILTRDGRVYWFGRNIYFRAGTSTASSHTPTLVQNLPAIKQIEIGNRHTMFLDYDGNVWTVGYNASGQLGNGATNTLTIPYKLTNLPKIKTIGVGDYSSFAIAENGDLYAWGDNKYGQLGFGDDIQRNSPKKVEGVLNVKFVEGGTKNSLLINELNELYVVGSDQYGQLGIGNPPPIFAEEQELVFPPNVSVTTANNQTLATGQTMIVNGEIVIEKTGKEIEVSYDLEGPSGKTNHLLKTYTSTSAAEPFNISIPITGDMAAGGYLITVKAKEVVSGVNSVKGINFSVTDLTNPEIDVDIIEIPEWIVTPLEVNVTASDLGGSGLKGYRYALTKNTAKPTVWSSIKEVSTDKINITETGTHYLHLEAYDNVNNVIYKYFGPYNIDVDPPDFVYTIPSGNQAEGIILPIQVNEISDLVQKKWAIGNQTQAFMETNGTNLVSNINITENGEYTLFAWDENNQKTLEVFEVTNIVYRPKLHRIKGKMIIPLLDKTNATISVNLSHREDLDPLWLRTVIPSGILNSSNNITGIRTNSDELYQMNFNALGVNTIYNSQFYLRDDQGLETVKVNSQIEIYDDNFKSRSSIDGITLTWNESKLAEKYRVLKNGFVLYEGIEEIFDDVNVNLGQSYVYELQVFDGEEYITIKVSSTEPGISHLTAPTSIGFGVVNLGLEKKITPTTIDQEFIEYENNFQLQKSYEFRIYASDLESQALNLIESENLRIKPSEIKNKMNTTILAKTEIIFSNTPIQVLHSNQLTEKNYFKWELLKSNIEFNLPDNTKIENGINEKYSGTIYTELVYGPN
jgi:alpha-tubulin suppressor-like RCC1 family protein